MIGQTVPTDELQPGGIYSREELRMQFGITDATLNNGVFRLKGTNAVWLFITETKTADRTQYTDLLEGDNLHWDGQTSGRTDDLIISHEENGIDLHVFYRASKKEYPHGGFRYEGKFKYLSHIAGKPSHFHLGRTTGSPEFSLLRFVPDIKGIRKNVRTFNDWGIDALERVESLLRQSAYWVWDADNDSFVPAKFAAFEAMTFDAYESEVDNGTNSRFDGTKAARQLSSITKQDFSPQPELGRRLVAWARRSFGVEFSHNVDTSKWLFIELQPTRRYRALMVNPSWYLIDDVLKARKFDHWTLPEGDLEPGDRLAIWRTGSLDGRRGIVAFAEVTEGPHTLEDSDEDPFWIGPKELGTRRVVKVRYFVNSNLPLWVDQDEGNVLSGLTVANGQGTQAYKITSLQWWRLMDKLGGWPLSEDLEPTDDAMTFKARIERLIEQGVGEMPTGVSQPERSNSSRGASYKRSPDVAAWVLGNANGICEYCQQQAPFKRPNGQWYLEPHHVIRLADGGSDTPQNVVALCPNCHRLMHSGEERKSAKALLYGNVSRLVGG